MRIKQEIHRARTSDNWNLVATRKVPAQKRLSYPFLLIHGLGQNRYTWDLPGRSMADWFAENGVDVWILELRGHGLSRNHRAEYTWNCDTYNYIDIPCFVEYILKKTRSDRVLMCGHSLGGTLCYTYAVDNQDKLAGIVTLGGPGIYGRGVPVMKEVSILDTFPARFTGKHLVEFLPHFKLRVLGWVCIGLFPLLHTKLEKYIPWHPWHRYNVEPIDLLRRIYLGFERVSPKVISQFTEWIASGSLTDSRGRDFIACMKDVKTPALIITGSADRLAPPESVMPAYRALGSRDKEFVIFSRRNHRVHWGHLDLTMGKYAPQEMWPFILKWLKNFS